MRPLSLTLALAAVLGFAAAPASSNSNATIWQGVLKVRPGAYSPVQPAGCHAPDQHGCPLGSYWVCGPDGTHCWCKDC
jgi:hypothetical protein